MGAHTAAGDIDRARDSRLRGRAVLTGVATLAMLGTGAGTALAAPGQHGTGNVVCGAEGGDLYNDATGTNLGQGAGPVASGNTGQLLSCNSFLNDNLNDVSINVLSQVVDNGGVCEELICDNPVPLP